MCVWDSSSLVVQREEAEEELRETRDRWCGNVTCMYWYMHRMMRMTRGKVELEED